MSLPRTILLVDDDREILQAMELFLSQRGYRVLTAVDGQMGLAVAERERPDVVVVDMMMPRQSGFVVLQQLKNGPVPAPRVIMITANEGSRHRAYAEILGVDDYLHKPFALETLLESLQRLCPLSEPSVTAANPLE